jgi:ABC-2 type transport system ATP-binding protein
MGWVPDAFGFYDNLTSREYLEFAGAAHGFTRGQAATRAAQLLGLARLEEYADQPVHVLSRGQKQRLGFVRALVHSPKVLLLDEPAAGLDPYSRVELRNLLRRLAASGIAVVVSSHILSDLELMADRVVFIDRGRVVGEQRMTDLGPAVGVQKWRLRALNGDSLVRALDQYGMPYLAIASGVEMDLGSEEEVAQLIERLVGSGVQVVSSAPVTSTLDAAYLTLTQGER